MPIIFRKTAKGLAEIETRANRLVPRMRSCLILVNGKRDVDDLKLLVTLHTDETWQALAEQGFIEAVGETVGVAAPAASFAVTPAPAPAPAGASAPAPALPPASAPAPAPAAVPRPAIDLADLRRQVVRALHEQLGPSAASLATRIEKSRSAEDLKPLVSQAVHLVAAARGRTAADAFATRMPML